MWQGRIPPASQPLLTAFALGMDFKHRPAKAKVKQRRNSVTMTSAGRSVHHASRQSSVVGIHNLSKLTAVPLVSSEGPGPASRPPAPPLRDVSTHVSSIPALPRVAPFTPYDISPAEAEAKLLPGKRIAREWLTELAGEVGELRAALGRAPGLAVVQVGGRRDSRVYVKNKEKACREVGIAFEEVRIGYVEGRVGGAFSM